MKIMIIDISITKRNLAALYLKSYLLKYLKKKNIIKLKTFSIKEKNKNIISQIKNYNPHLIGFSCYLWNIKKILKICKKIKNKKNLIVLGGPEASPLSYEILKRNTCIDIVVRNEGEKSFLEIIKNFSRNNFKNILGITYRKNDKIISNKERNFINLKTLPSPFLNNLDNVNKSKRIVYETYRGCIYKCNFCNWNKNKMRYFPLNRIKKELKIICLSDIELIWFIDSIANINKSRFKEILKFLIKINKKNIAICFELRAELIDQESIELLSKLKNGYIAFGLQSFNRKVLNTANRIYNLNQIRKNIISLREKKLNIDLYIDLIYGLPYDTYNSSLKSIEYVMSLRPNKIQFHKFTILPGTEFYNKVNKFCLISKKGEEHSIEKTFWINKKEFKELDKWADIYLEFFRLPIVHSTVYILSNYTKEKEFEIFRQLLKYSKYRFVPELKKRKIKKIYKIMVNFIKFKLKNNKKVISPFLDLLKYFYFVHITTFPNPIDTIKNEKFNYEINKFLEKNFLNKKIKFNNIKKKTKVITYLPKKDFIWS